MLCRIPAVKKKLKGGISQEILHYFQKRLAETFVLHLIYVRIL